MNKIKLRYIPVILLFITQFAFANSEEIRIVGSSTLYPFITIAAEKFGRISGKTPVVEATGTGGGFHLFCMNGPDIVNASRKIHLSEESLCKNNNVTYKSIEMGYDGIIIAKSKEAKKLNLQKKDLFLALAKKIPHNGKLVDNFYKTWKQVNPKLPNVKIEVYGPSFTSGTRDAFIELVMHEFCEASSCREIREDEAYIEMPENDNLIIYKLLNNKHALGIISFSLLAENSKIRAAYINDIYPTTKSIVNGNYPLARPLYIYINLNHFKKSIKLQKFIDELTSNRSIGSNGYLTQKGLLTIKTQS